MKHILMSVGEVIGRDLARWRWRGGSEDKMSVWVNIVVNIICLLLPVAVNALLLLWAWCVGGYVSIIPFFIAYFGTPPTLSIVALNALIMSPLRRIKIAGMSLLAGCFLAFCFACLIAVRFFNS